MLIIVEIAFPESVPHPDKFSWGALYELLSGWQEPTTKNDEVISRSSNLYKYLKLY